MTNCLNVLYKCMKFRWNIFDGYQVIEQSRFCDRQTHQQRQGGKIYMLELWFLCMTCHLNVLYKCMKFRWNTSNGYQVIERTQNSIANDQREIIPKISNAELWFLCMTRPLNVLYKCMKFRWNISNGYQDIESTGNSKANDQREITPKNPKQSYVLMHDTSSECALQMYEVWKGGDAILKKKNSIWQRFKQRFPACRVMGHSGCIML